MSSIRCKSWFSAPSAAGALALACLAPVASLEAVPVDPGELVSLFGRCGPGGTIVRDTSVPFAIRDSSGFVVMSGDVQDRVVRTTSGDLIFAPRIRNVVATTAFGISRVSRDGFIDNTTDVDFSTCSAGTQFPDACRRSGDGDTLDYLFGFAPIFNGSESVFFQCISDADLFSETSGRMTITLENGLSTTIQVAAPVTDDTRPNVRITGPAPEGCVCRGLNTITGVVCDAESALTWTLRGRRSSDPNGTGWFTIDSSTSEVCSGGMLTVWDSSSLSNGEYILELEAVNAVGLSSTAAIEVRLVDDPPAPVVRYPDAGGIVGGTTCLEGTISPACFDSYKIAYESTSTGASGPIDPSNPSYGSPVINDPLGFWDTRTVPDGLYTITATVGNVCGNQATTELTVEVDNTRPVAEITSVTPCDWYSGIVEVRGEVFDANISSWVLEYTGGGSRSWTRIASGSGNIAPGGLIASWDTTGLERCAYTLRLRANDRSLHGCEGRGGVGNARDLVSANVGCYADCNGDGMLDIFDFLCFQDTFVAGCP